MRAAYYTEPGRPEVLRVGDDPGERPEEQRPPSGERGAHDDDVALQHHGRHGARHGHDDDGERRRIGGRELAPHHVGAKGAKAAGFRVVIAGAGGAAHLPGMAAAMTPLPVFGVPVESKALSGQDSLLSIVQMPAGIPVGTLAIGRAGAVNAALLAAAVLALTDDDLAGRLDAWRARQSAAVAEHPDTSAP